MTNGNGYALITGGGTSAPVDAVRSMANGAEGDTALAIAHALSKRGVPVVLVLSRLAFYKHQNRIPAAAVVLVYGTYAEYVATIRRAVGEYGRPAYALSTAAVSDYGYLERPSSKIRSDGDALRLVLPPLPKEIDCWRALFGEACRIIGFKLLTRHDDTPDTLIAAARRQNDRAQLDATIANFQEDVGDLPHPIWFALEDGRAFRLDGTRDELAEAIAAFALSTKVKASSTVLVRNRATDRVLMLHRGDGGPHPNKWVPPGGGEEPGDVELARTLNVSVPFATGIRETDEEAKVNLRGVSEPAETFVGFSSSTDAAGNVRCWFNTAFLVERDQEDVAEPDHFETIEARWLGREECRELVTGPLTLRSLRALVWADL